MQLLAAVTGALCLTLFLLLSTTTDAHNITKILAKHPDFSTFNHYLSLTHLADEINRRQTITVCAVDNAAMSTLIAKNYNLYTLRNILSLHVFADYFGTKKLHQITKGSTLTATLFQATGKADGMSGYVNITDLKGGKVGFGTDDSEELSARFVKSVQEMPYNISVIQISQILSSAEAEAPTSGPTLTNLTVLMAKQGCKAFGDLVTSSGAEHTYTESVDGGLTVFCPSDAAVKAFLPKYNKLKKSEKTSLVLYHAVPVYQSMQSLKSSNGLINTLATDGSDKYDFTVQNKDEDVTLKTGVITAAITGTALDQDQLIIYSIDKVLQPTELFKASAEAPKAAKGKKSDSEDEADAPSPDSDAADQTADDNAAGRFAAGGIVVAALSLFLVL